IANILITLSVIASLIISFKFYTYYKRKKINKLINSKDLFRESELGLFIALVAKVAKADGRVSELEAQLIGMMFDDISKVFVEKEKARGVLKEIFNDEKQKDNVVEVAARLNKIIGKSILKRRQYLEFLVQLAFIDNGVGDDEDKVLRQIIGELNISSSDYEAILSKFENMAKSKNQGISLEKAYEILGVTQNDDMNTIKKRYRTLVRQYHPDIIKSQDKDEAYIEEATAKTQEINQAYQIIKDSKK
ncbi:MAG: DnaJ domain-containing protein, partial [Campylobacterales bacterium]|nr:DnaJ domain-containing protein [Campylobacterales bacterium]